MVFRARVVLALVVVCAIARETAAQPVLYITNRSGPRCNHGCLTANLYVVDVTNNQGASIALPDNATPDTVLLTADGARAYVFLRGYVAPPPLQIAAEDRVAIIDTATRTILALQNMDVANEAVTSSFRGVLSPDERRLFIGVKSRHVVVLDTSTTTLLPDRAALSGVPRGMAISAARHELYVATSASVIEVIDTVTMTRISEFTLTSNPVDVAFSETRHELYVATAGQAGVVAIDVVTGTRRDIALRDVPSRLKIAPDDGRLFAVLPDTVHLINVTDASIVQTFGTQNSTSVAATADSSRVFTVGPPALDALQSVGTYRAFDAESGIEYASGDAAERPYVYPVDVAAGPAESCTFAPTRSSLVFGAVGGTQTIDVPAQGGCPWLASTADKWLTFEPSMIHVGPGSVQVLAAAGDAAAATVTIARSTVRVLRTVPRLAIDAPAQGASVGSSFLIGGWAIDDVGRTAAEGSGAGAIHVWAYPASGGAPRFVGAVSCTGKRPDVAAVYGDAYLISGWNLTVAYLPAGAWRLLAYAFSAHTGTFSNVGAVNISVLPPRPLMWIDAPRDSTVVREPFAVTGWALDLAAADNGIDVVHVYAYPWTGGAPIFVGAAAVDGARPDVGAFFGAAHSASGYGLLVRGLAPAGYTLVVFGHSSFGAGFTIAQTVDIRVESSSMLVLDAPSNGAIVRQGFLVGGWAADFAAASGGGIDIVHIYAYPLDRPGGAVMLGAASVDVSRPDVGAYFGAQFSSTGFNILAPPLQPGMYRVVAYGRSLVTGTFSIAATTDVTMR